MIFSGSDGKLYQRNDVTFQTSQVDVPEFSAQHVRIAQDDFHRLAGFHAAYYARSDTQHGLGGVGHGEHFFFVREEGAVVGTALVVEHTAVDLGGNARLENLADVNADRQEVKVEVRNRECRVVGDGADLAYYFFDDLIVLLCGLRA